MCWKSGGNETRGTSVFNIGRHVKRIAVGFGGVRELQKCEPQTYAYCRVSDDVVYHMDAINVDDGLVPVVFPNFVGIPSKRLDNNVVLG